MSVVSFPELDDFLSDHGLALRPEARRRQYLVATRDIKAGSLIYTLPPLYAFPQIDQAGPARCFACFEDLGDHGFCCGACKSVTYCSPPCQQAHWRRWHHIECQTVKDLRMFPRASRKATTDRGVSSSAYAGPRGAGEFDPEAAMIVGVAGVLAHVNRKLAHAPPPLGRPAVPGWQVLQTKAYTHLLSHRALLPGDLVSRFTLLAKTLLGRGKVRIEDLVKEATGDATTPFDAIVNMACRFHCNNFICHDASLFSVGEMAHPVTSLLFNHSCLPNCIPLYDRRGNQVVRAIEDIPAGQELTIAYTDPITPRTMRLKRLKHAYAFDCLCPRCTGEPAASPGHFPDPQLMEAFWQRQRALDRDFDSECLQRSHSASHSPLSPEAVPDNLLELVSDPKHAPSFAVPAASGSAAVAGIATPGYEMYLRSWIEYADHVPARSLFAKFAEFSKFSSLASPIDRAATDDGGRAGSSNAKDSLALALYAAWRVLLMYKLMYPRHHPMTAYQEEKLAALLLSYLNTYVLSEAQRRRLLESVEACLSDARTILLASLGGLDAEANGSPPLVGVEAVRQELATLIHALESAKMGPR
ncbi:hypothetical protein EV182_001141 [Spiromyces aspiralis]|uniref:Uncharacterized protein n=1 Tax=Spiromyces aspiralis TaxID=68401 RepID=A0ACC1HK39_9FUNG|nr:hypothetical protein EV182_001141 [Spiromyces aspiralis]